MNRVFFAKRAKIVNCKSHAMLGIYFNNALQIEIDVILSISNSKVYGTKGSSKIEPYYNICFVCSVAMGGQGSTSMLSSVEVKSYC
jgi:hypothetical protein